MLKVGKRLKQAYEIIGLSNLQFFLFCFISNPFNTDEANSRYNLVIVYVVIWVGFSMLKVLYKDTSETHHSCISWSSSALFIVDFELNIFNKTFSTFNNLIVQNQEWKHQSNVSNLFKVNIKDARTTSGQTHFKNLATNVKRFLKCVWHDVVLVSLLTLYSFTHCSGVLLLL